MKFIYFMRYRDVLSTNVKTISKLKSLPLNGITQKIQPAVKLGESPAW